MSVRLEIDLERNVKSCPICFSLSVKSLLQNSMKTLKSTNFQVRKGTLSPLSQGQGSSGDRVPFPTCK